MPNRVIREGLLDSERYWSVSIEARELYRHLQLIADDFGCVSLAPVLLKRRCFDQPPSEEKLEKLLAELTAKPADLLREYNVRGARYGFIPRFGQRLRRMTLKHPRPVDNILEGDDEAKDKFSKINGNGQYLTAGGRTDDGPMTVTRPSRDRHPSDEVEVEVESNRIRKEVESKRETAGASKGAPLAPLKSVFVEQVHAAMAAKRNRGQTAEQPPSETDDLGTIP